MALLYYMQSVCDYYHFKVVAINVEHGIRGESSILDTNFVKDYCSSHSIPLFCYTINSLEKAKEYKMGIEECARKLRYDCFFDCIERGNCDLIATAHHLGDNLESVLLNLFRGASIKGIKGINEVYKDKIIRPFLSVSKSDILEYIAQNDVPFVTDETNFDDDYTRNFLRLNVIPTIKQVFPDAEKSVGRLSLIAKEEDEFLDGLSHKVLKRTPDGYLIPISTPDVIFKRATIIALKELGLQKDWEKTHIDSVLSLKNLENGSIAILPKNICAIREYENVVLYLKEDALQTEIPFALGDIPFQKTTISIKKVEKLVNLKDGLYFDLDKIPKTAIIRTKREGDKFTKFGGGTKSLGDYLTDKKVPYRLRDSIPLIADGNVVYVIGGVEISQQVKVTDTTKTIVKFQQGGNTSEKR